MPERPPDEAVRQDTLTEGDLSVAATPEAADAARQIVFVAGPGRSGTSLMSGILKHMGLHVPEPEVAADKTNPKGFGEPEWVVDFHEELLGRVHVQPGDARPGAWFDAGRACIQEMNRSRLAEWLEPQFEAADALVIKDPRISWFLGLWRVAAVRVGASTSTVVMLRPPAEVVGSASATADGRSDETSGRLDDISRLAGWTNVMLFTERATRGSSRSFVRYHDLLADWTSTVVRVGEALGLADVTNAGTGRMQEVHRLRGSRAAPEPHHLGRPLGARPRCARSPRRRGSSSTCLPSPAATPRRSTRRWTCCGVTTALLYAEAEALARSSVDAAGPAYLEATREAAASRRMPTRPHRARSTSAPAGPRAGSSGACATAGDDHDGVLPAAAEPRGARRLRGPVADGCRALEPGLTSVLRVKNEARSLPWVLPPLFRAVQHVVVVDNQSDDGTPEVARAVADQAGAGDRLIVTGVPVQRQPVRRRAPRHPRGLRAQPRLLLQLVLRPRADRLLDEVGRRHGPDPRRASRRSPTSRGSSRTSKRWSRCRGTRCSWRATGSPISTST